MNTPEQSNQNDCEVTRIEEARDDKQAELAFVQVRLRSYREVEKYVRQLIFEYSEREQQLLEELQK